MSPELKTARLDPSFKREVLSLPYGETLKICFNCGTCTSSCPIARFTASYRPRTLIHMTQLGMKSRVLSSDSLWLCAACFTCTDRCPQGVEVASLIRLLRNIAVKEGYLPDLFKRLGSVILKTGYAYRISPLRLKNREGLGLPKLPSVKSEDVEKLSRVTGFSDIIEEEGGE